MSEVEPIRDEVRKFINRLIRCSLYHGSTWRATITQFVKQLPKERITERVKNNHAEVLAKLVGAYGI